MSPCSSAFSITFWDRCEGFVAHRLDRHSYQLLLRNLIPEIQITMKNFSHPMPNVNASHNKPILRMPYLFLCPELLGANPASLTRHYAIRPSCFLRESSVTSDLPNPVHPLNSSANLIAAVRYHSCTSPQVKAASFMERRAFT